MVAQPEWVLFSLITFTDGTGSAQEHHIGTEESCAKMAHEIKEKCHTVAYLGSKVPTSVEVVWLPRNAWENLIAPLGHTGEEK